MITRVIQRKRPRSLALLIFLGAILVAAGLFAAVAVALSDSGSYSVEVDNKKQSDEVTLGPGGATVQYLGSSDPNAAVNYGSSGTGTFNPFVRLQGSPEEAGYNTNGTLEFDSKAGTWTKAILVSGIPTVPCPTVALPNLRCWELFVDINDSNNATHISLNTLEIYYAAAPGGATLTGYDFGTNADLQYDFSGEILINDVNQGSGRGDLRYLIPVGAGTDIAIPAGCSYGSTIATCGTYFVLYSEWGATGDSGDFNYNSEGGFEEWKVLVYPVLANPTVGTLIQPLGPYGVGAVLHDTATLTGETATAGGTITYKLFSDNACTTLVADLTPTPPANNVVNGVVPDSLEYTFTTAGNFWFWAEYSGDAANNGPVNSGCTSEPLTIGQGAPAAKSTPLVEIRDSISVGTFSAPASVVPVRVGLFSDSTCATQVGGFTDFAVPAAGGTVTGMTSFVSVLTGTHYFQISYAGDTNNAAFTSACTAESVAVTITTTIPLP